MPFKSHGEVQSQGASPKQMSDENKHSTQLDGHSGSNDGRSSSGAESTLNNNHDEHKKVLENRNSQEEKTAQTKQKASQTKTEGTGKRARTLLTLAQSRVLHELLQQTCFPSTKVREAVAAELGLSPRKVQVFFQNKRQKQRKKANLAAFESRNEQQQQMASNTYTSSTTIPEPNADKEHGSSCGPKLLPSTNADWVSSPSHMREMTQPKILPRPPHNPYGYDAGWSSQLMQQRRPRQVYHPYAATHWHRHVGTRPALYPITAPNKRRGGYTRQPMDTSTVFLPPIMSNVRPNGPTLPSINELISGSNA